MNKTTRRAFLAVAAILLAAGAAQADVFGTGENQITIDFVPISGASNPTSGIPAGDGFTFTGHNNDYRMGIYEITNEQWTKFRNAYGAVTGYPLAAYQSSPIGTGTNVPINASWCEAAQFVNWLNTSTGHQAAYKFTGTLGTSDYTLATWGSADADNGVNLYRHKDAFYYLPTEDEWVKAAYWNGTSLQTYANASSGDLVSGLPDPVKWNYIPSFGSEPWNVGSGSQELNGTYDMMGNVREWMESPYNGGYDIISERGQRGGSCHSIAALASSYRYDDGSPTIEHYDLGFRVASEVPEPATLSLLALGGLAMLRRKRT